MLKGVSKGLNRLLAGSPKVKRVNLALQGGGAYGAFTWGVLDHLLEDGRLSVAGISGASAGAVNAVMLADGLARGGSEPARQRLTEFWQAASLAGSLPGAQRAVMDRLFSFLPAETSPVQLFMDTMGRFMSPYDLNPLNINPLKDLIERFADFEAIRNFKALQLFISATNVQTGQLRVFRREHMTADVVMASAALPMMFRAVEIEGEPYWDGGFAGNPTLVPLVNEVVSDDTILVPINPIERPGTPRTARDILNRVNEISFNAVALKELKMLALLRQAAAGAGGEAACWARMRMHIMRNHVMVGLGYSSKLNGEWAFLVMLREEGRRSAEAFLKAHGDDVGRRSTADLDELLAEC